RMLNSHGVPIALGVSSDGGRLFWLSVFGVLRVADAGRLEELPLLVRPTTDRPTERAPEYIIGVSPDGTRYASVAWAVSLEEENSVAIKQTATGEVVGRVPSKLDRKTPGYSFTKARAGSTLPARAVFSRDGKYIAIWSLGYSMVRIL